MNWLDQLMSQHSELEAPMPFWFWAGLAAVSAVIKDNVWLDRQIHYLYPNIYVMLHADSGLKKGPPISMAKRLVRAVGGTRLISGRSSIQGILKELGTAYTAPGERPIMKSVAAIFSSELTSSLVEDKVATDILTDLYDRQYNDGEWKSLLKMETFNLKDPTITMLTATNEAHSTDFFGKKDVHGGYFARTFIVTENKRNKINSLIAPLKNPPNYDKSIEYLKCVAKLKGPFRPLAVSNEKEEYKIYYEPPEETEPAWYSPAGYLYQRWYENFTDVIMQNDVNDDTGTLNRFGDSVLKVAMLLSLTKKPELVIDEESMQSAIDQCERLIGNVRAMTHGKKGLSDARLIKGLIIKDFVERETHQISRPTLLKKMWAHFKGAQELDDIMYAFDQSGTIKTQTIGNTIVYTMPDHIVEEYKRHFAGKNK